MSSCAVRRLSVFIVLALFAAIPAARSQSTWTGLASPSNLWTNTGNWNPNAVPVSGEFAEFTGAGNGNTTINLGGATQPIRDVLFSTASVAAYTIGQSPGDALSFDGGGTLYVNPGVTNPQVFNAKVITNGFMEVHNGVNSGATSGNGVVGLTLGEIHLAGGSNLIIDNGVGTIGLVNTTTILNGNITEAAGIPGSLLLRATVGGGANNTNFIINGTNTYTGGTTIQANTGTSGSIQIGTDSAFGTGKITTITSANNGEIRALGGTRTISNAIDLNQGLAFAGTNTVVLNGPIAIASGSSRTISSKITGGSAALMFGASPGSSTIHLGNPVSNGGDGAGRMLIVSAATVTGASTAGSIVVNALFQDVDASSPTSAVNYGGNSPGQIIINTPQTYTSETRLGGGSSTVQFKHDYITGGTSGPFGLGTLIANSAANTQIAPTTGDRTVANPFRLDFGFTVINMPSDPSGVTFSGPITFGGCFTANGDSPAGVSCGAAPPTQRLIQQNMPSTGGTLTLGSAASPSTLTLAADQPDKSLVFSGGGKTVVNDTIQDGNANITHIGVTNSNTTTFNGTHTTNGNFSVTGANSTVIMNANRTGSGTMTVNGANAKLFVNGTKSGSGAVTVTAGTLGGTGSIAGDVTNNARIGPGTSVGTLTMTNNVTMGTNSHLEIELSGATADKLVVGGNLNLSNVDFLDVTGTGTGSSWIIATYGGTLTGTFDNVTSGYSVNYGSGTNSQITLNLAGLPGDFNSDGKVDAGDYVTWRKNDGTNNALANDNGLGTPVGPAHYNLWRANFGNPPGSGSSNSLGDATTVPEPATMLLALIGIATFSALRARRRNTN